MEIKNKVHENHLGTEACKRRARDTIYCQVFTAQIA